MNSHQLVSQLHARLDETLALSAPVTWEQGLDTCYKDPYSDYDCSGYHRIWQYLMLWRITTSMRPESARFMDDFRRLARSGDYARVFVSGTADYTITAHILAAYEAEKAPVDITVLDICRTPLLANLWYAQHEKVKINTIQDDIFRFTTDRVYDAVCTHSFFLWYPLDRQFLALRKWHELLRPGGIILTSTRLYAGEPDSFLEMNDADAGDFRERIRNAALSAGGERNPDPGMIADVGYEYMTGKRKRYIVNDARIYREMFETAGFEIECLDLCDDSKQKVRPTGPKRGSIGRLHIIARRI